MKHLIIFLVIFILALLKATFLPFDLLFGLICFLSISGSFPLIFLWAFTAGIFLDLFTLQPLGLSSLGFLSVVAVFSLYRKRFSLKSPLIVFFFVFSTHLLFDLFSGKSLSFQASFGWALLFTLARFLIPGFFESFGQQEEIKLKL